MFPSPSRSHSSSGVFGPKSLWSKPELGSVSVTSSSLVIGPRDTRVTCNGVGGQKTGSRIADYKRTAVDTNSTGKLVSISAMPAYKAKSHEELRWEDNYNFIEKGDQCGSTSLASWRTTSIPSTPVFKANNAFEKTIPSKATTWNYPGPSSTSFTSQPFQISPSANTCSPFDPNLTSSASTSVSAIAAPLFNQFIPRTTNLTSTAASTGSSFSFPTLVHNPFIIPSTSLPTHTTVKANNNPFEITFPSKATTWNYPGPSSTSFTSQPLQISPSANTCSPFDPFIPRTNLTSTSSTSVTATAPLFNQFNPRTTTLTSTAASTGSSISFPSLKHNPFLNPSTSLPTHTSSTGPRFEAFTGLIDTKSSSLNHFWPTPISGPFPCTVTAAANSSSVSPGFSSTFNQPTTVALFNLCDPLAQNYNGSTTAAANSSSVLPGLSSTSNQPTTAAPLFNPCDPSGQNCNGSTTGIIDQTSVSQLSSGKPLSAANPFRTLPPNPHMFFSDSQKKQSIQYGISSIPVKDKLAPVKSSLLTARLSSGRIKRPVRKYDPTLNARKIPYFSDTTDMLPVASYIPRENPRALMVCPERWPLKSMVENDSDDPTDKKQASTPILDVPSKLKQPDYYTLPQISELEVKEQAEPGFCRRVKDFVVGRHGYGSIKFLGETDVTNIDIESEIQFNNREVIVYVDDTKKPPVGEGLNKPAEITLLNVKCIDKKTGMQYTSGSKVNEYIEMLKKAVAQGVEFMSYDPVEGEWKFRVQHF